MKALRVFPTRFAGRLALVFVSIFLMVLVVMLWRPVGKSLRTESGEQTPFSPQLLSGGRRGSKSLVLPGEPVRPNVLDTATDEVQSPMYQHFADGGNQLDSDWKPPSMVAQPNIIPVADSKTGGGKKKSGDGKKGKKNRKSVSIDCRINDETRVGCILKNSEVYMPFNKFIRQYFEVYGDLERSVEDMSSPPVFNFRHSIETFWVPESPYTPTGEFLFFKSYDVGGRSKVEAISARHSVPVSNQWLKTGYIYPIQVAQYGLSHYSKAQTELGSQTDRVTVLEDGEGKLKWHVPLDSLLQYKEYSKRQSAVYFNVSASEPPYPTLNITESRLATCLSFDMKLLSPKASVSVVIDAESGLFVLTYTSGNFWKKTGVDDMVYGAGNCTDWCTLHRDLMIDFKKFLPDVDKWHEYRKKLRSILHIEVKGEGWIDNITISESCHMDHFKAASDWLASNQDSAGGWPVSVTRVITTRKLTLKPGWYSAMAQGQAISLLVRAYHVYKQPKYLRAAEKGLSIYQNHSTNGGVKAVFMKQYVWYEEYPTTPPIFVLNGFIYSLFGLYDLSQIGQGQAKVTAKKLFDDGMLSLKALLPIYDSGIGSFYDLRHLMLPGLPPNRARWEYHAVHIAQLYYLNSIEPTPIFNSTADRWLAYASGQWAPHN